MNLRILGFNEILSHRMIQPLSYENPVKGFWDQMRFFDEDKRILCFCFSSVIVEVHFQFNCYLMCPI